MAVKEIQMTMWERPEGKLSCKMVIFVVLVLTLLPRAVCKVPVVKCSSGEPLPFLYKFYQSGELVVAGVLSQSYMFSTPMSFDKRPSHELFNDLV